MGKKACDGMKANMHSNISFAWKCMAKVCKMHAGDPWKGGIECESGKDLSFLVMYTSIFTFLHLGYIHTLFNFFKLVLTGKKKTCSP